MNTALVLSGGSGKRAATNIPKQYLEMNGKMIIEYCLDTICHHKYIDSVCIVADQKYHELLEQVIRKYNNNIFLYFATPGETRQLSILSGLQKIKNDMDTKSLVFIHDSARPFLTSQMITDCFLGMCDGNENDFDQNKYHHEGVIPVLPMKDTVYLTGMNGCISSLLDRNRVVAGQAPELFLYEKYYQANVNLLPNRIMSINGSTEVAIIGGMDIKTIPGDERNYKITTPADIERMKMDIL